MESVGCPTPFVLLTNMTDSSFVRRARRAGLIVKKHRRATVYIDPVTGKTVSDGNRSKKSYRQERCIDSFIRMRERGGLP